MDELIFEYSIPKNFYNNNREMADDEVLSLRIQNIIINYHYQSVRYEQFHEVYIYEIKSNLDKRQLNHYFSTRVLRGETKQII